MGLSPSRATSGAPGRAYWFGGGRAAVKKVLNLAFAPSPSIWPGQLTGREASISNPVSQRGSIFDDVVRFQVAEPPASIQGCRRRGLATLHLATSNLLIPIGHPITLDPYRTPSRSRFPSAKVAEAAPRSLLSQQLEIFAQREIAPSRNWSRPCMLTIMIGPCKLTWLGIEHRGSTTSPLIVTSQRWHSYVGLCL